MQFWSRFTDNMGRTCVFGYHSPALLNGILTKDIHYSLNLETQKDEVQHDPSWRQSEWQLCLQQSCSKKVVHQYVKHLTDTWQVSLSGSTLLCSAHLKNPGEASCPWVESHCGQPAPQVPCHPVLSWTMPPGWSIYCGRDVSFCVCLFLNFSVCMPPLSADRVWSWADPPPLYLTGAN